MANAQITVRKNIYRRVRNLSDDEVQRVLEFIDSLEDEEPLTTDELAQIEESKAGIAAGRTYTLEKFNRMLDALP